MGVANTLTTINLNIMKYTINKKGNKKLIKEYIHNHFMDNHDCKVVYSKKDICELYTGLYVYRIDLIDLCRLYYYVQVEYFNIKDIEKRELNLFNIKRIYSIYKQPK